MQAFWELEPHPLEACTIHTNWTIQKYKKWISRDFETKIEDRENYCIKRINILTSFALNK